MDAFEFTPQQAPSTVTFYTSYLLLFRRREIDHFWVPPSNDNNNKEARLTHSFACSAYFFPWSSFLYRPFLLTFHGDPFFMSLLLSVVVNVLHAVTAMPINPIPK
jgi:hypothetical protein